MFWLIAILLASLYLFVSGHVSHRAGLLFDESGTFAVNGDHLLYRRVADTSTLVKAAGQTADLTLIYHALCTNVEKLAYPLTQREKNTYPTEIVYKATPMTFPLKDSFRACLMMGGRLPEARNERARMKIQLAAVEAGVSAVVAGIEWDAPNSVHRYQSDKSMYHSTTFPEVEYGGDWTGTHHLTQWDNHHLKKMYGRYSFMYTYVKNKFGLRMMDKNDQNFQQKIICEFPPDPLNKEPPQVSDNMLYKLAAHNCRRDRASLVGTTAFTLAEVDTLTQLKLNEKRQIPNFRSFFPQVSFYSDNTTVYDHITFSEKEKTMFDSRTEVVRLAPSLLPYYDFLSSFNETVSSKRDKRDIDVPSDIPISSAMKNYISHALDKLERVIDYNIIGQVPELHFMANVENNSSRIKRDIPTVDPVLAAGIEAGITSSSGSNNAPLAFIGEIMSNLFGTVTRRDAVTVAKMVKVATAVQSLTVNQGMMAHQFDMVKKRVKFFQDQTLSLLEGTAVLTMVNDLKMHVLHMQTLLQVTMSKYAHILMSAAIGRTSPYALKRSEIGEFSKSLPKSRWLVDDLTRITTTAAISDNQLMLMFKIPVMSDEDMYNLYKITAMPTFRDNVTLFPILDTEHVAISKSGNRFISITEDEYQQCLNHPDACTAASPTRPNDDRATCVIRTFATRKLQCLEHKTVLGQDDFIYKKERRVFYSVPRPVDLFVKCLDHIDSHITNDTSVRIEEKGEITFRPSCTITLPDGSSFRSRVESEVVDLAELPIFTVLKFMPLTTNITIQAPIRYMDDIPNLDLVNFEVPEMKDFVRNTFNPSTLFTGLVHFMLWTPMVLILGLVIYCCFPKIKACYHTCRGRRGSIDLDLNQYDMKGSMPHVVMSKRNRQQETEAPKASYASRVSSLREYVASVFTKAPHEQPRRPSRDSTDSWIERVENRLRSESPPPRIHHV